MLGEWFDDSWIDYRIWHWPIKFSFVPLIAFLIILIWVCGDFSNDNMNIALGFYFKERTAVVDMIRKGEILPDRNGVAELPMQYKKLSADGNIYVDESAGLLTVFYLTSTKNDKVIGYIYSGDNKTPSLSTNLGVGFNFKKIKDHWFYVKGNHAKTH
jgi:hypothetical protein